MQGIVLVISTYIHLDIPQVRSVTCLHGESFDRERAFPVYCRSSNSNHIFKVIQLFIINILIIDI